jgi:integrase
MAAQSLVRITRTWRKTLHQNVVLVQFLIMEALSKVEFLQLLATAKQKSERDWLMILIHFWHGLRNSEVRAIRRDDIANGYLKIVRLKGSESGVQELVEHPNPLLNERQALIDYAAKSNLGQPLFRMCRQTYWRHVRAHALAAGIPKHKAKTTVLKHTLATLMIENAPINKVQRRLGHKALSSTGRYMTVKDQDVDRVVVDAVGFDSIDL